MKFGKAYIIHESLMFEEDQIGIVDGTDVEMYISDENMENCGISPEKAERIRAAVPDIVAALTAAGYGVEVLDGDDD